MSSKTGLGFISSSELKEELDSYGDSDDKIEPYYRCYSWFDYSSHTYCGSLFYCCLLFELSFIF